MRTILALIVAIAIPASAQAPAQSPAAPAPSAKPATNPLDKIVCRTEDSLGSRLNKKRVCLTVREWREMSEGSREATERIQQGQGVVKF